jgi:hypothetical protein
MSQAAATGAVSASGDKPSQKKAHRVPLKKAMASRYQILFFSYCNLLACWHILYCRISDDVEPSKAAAQKASSILAISSVDATSVSPPPVTIVKGERVWRLVIMIASNLLPNNYFNIWRV